jgi:hypothetical protein
MSSILLWKPSVMPLLLENRHIRTREIFLMPLHQRCQTANLAPFWIKITPEFSEVIFDQPDHVKSIGYDFGIREVRFCDTSVGR